MRFIDWFAGTGGFRRGMELAGHECVGFCEFDKYAVMSYVAMHLCTQKQLDYIKTLSFEDRQKEILKEQYRNGEWYRDDIRTVDANDIPDSDCWCFGFPCQDISIQNKSGQGFRGSRSSLFFRVMYMVGQLKEEKRPSYLFIENVKNLLSVNGGWDFARLLSELDKNGYDAEWCVLNSKNFGVPHNRERVFVVGHLRGRDTKWVFPIQREDGDDQFGVTTNMSPSVVGGIGEKKSNKGTQYYQQDRIYDGDKIATSLSAKLPGGANLYSIRIVSDQDKEDENGKYVQISDNLSVYAIWNPIKKCYMAVRRLTPKECFRLQGWSDDYFDKASLVNQDNNLYKQVGNGVTVNVIEEIAKRM